MIDRIGVQGADVEASLAFYLGVFAPIGMREARRVEAVCHGGQGHGG